MTALRASFLDPRVEAALTLDPWMFVHLKDTMEGTFKLSIPHIAVNSGYFDTICKFDTYGAIKRFFENSTGKFQESYIVKKIYH